jgi:dihydroflavonol-4-reductase
MKILVTGASGFIGSQLVRRLKQTDHQVFCLVRKTSNIRLLEELGVSLIIGDVTDQNSLVQGMKGCDWVMNLANVYSFWEPDKRVFTLVNLEGTRNIMESALQTNISKIIHVSTVVIYGKPQDIPFTEESQVGSVRFSEYSRTKYMGDQIAWEYYQKKGLPLVVIYPAAVLGPGDPKATGKYIQNLIHRRLPATVFDYSFFTFVHVRDVAEAILRAAEKENNIGQKYIIGKYQLIFGEINRMVSEISGVPLPKIHLPDLLTMINAHLLTALANLIKKPPLWGMAIDQMRVMKEGVRADGSKAERELGLNYTPIKVALEETIASFK